MQAKQESQRLGAADTRKLLQAVFSRYEPNLLFMVFSRELLVMDLSILQTVRVCGVFATFFFLTP